MNITKTAMINAVNELLAAEFPTATVYKNKEPTEFLRPAFLIMSPVCKIQGVARNIIRETLYLTITCFAPVDDYGNCDSDELAEIQQRVVDLFCKGFVKVDDRAAKIAASDGGQDLDRAWVDLTCVYHSIRGETENLPMMEQIETRYKEE